MDEPTDAEYRAMQEFMADSTCRELFLPLAEILCSRSLVDVALKQVCGTTDQISKKLPLHLEDYGSSA